MATTKISEGVVESELINPSIMSTAEAEGGTDTNARTMSAEVLKEAILAQLEVI